MMLLALHGISADATQRSGRNMHLRGHKVHAPHYYQRDRKVQQSLRQRELQKEKKQKLKVDCDAIYDGDLDNKFLKKFVKKCNHLPFTDMPSMVPSLRPSRAPSIRPSSSSQPR